MAAKNSSVRSPLFYVTIVEKGWSEREKLEAIKNIWRRFMSENYSDIRRKGSHEFADFLLRKFVRKN